jgi:hypothetical protein
MTRAEQYRRLADEVRQRAASEKSPILKAEWENLSQTYVRLAEQSERNGRAGATFDPLNESRKPTQH